MIAKSDVDGKDSGYLFTVAYTGVSGGLVIVSADDPGMASSQNEQDNRRFAVAAGLPMLEPADSQEAYDFTFLAFELSERWHVPVLLTSSTRGWTTSLPTGRPRRAPPRMSRRSMPAIPSPGMGTRVIKTAVRAPNLNAVAPDPGFDRVLVQDEIFVLATTNRPASRLGNCFADRRDRGSLPPIAPCAVQSDN